MVPRALGVLTAGPRKPIADREIAVIPQSQLPKPSQSQIRSSPVSSFPLLRQSCFPACCWCVKHPFGQCFCPSCNAGDVARSTRDSGHHSRFVQSFLLLATAAPVLGVDGVSLLGPIHRGAVDPRLGGAPLRRDISRSPRRVGRGEPHCAVTDVMGQKPVTWGRHLRQQYVSTCWLAHLSPRSAASLPAGAEVVTQAGIAEKPLRMARERLRIKPRKSAFAGGWEWGLPTLQDAQDAQVALSK